MDNERKRTIRKFLFETLRCAPYAADRPPGIEPAPAPVEAQKKTSEE